MSASASRHLSLKAKLEVLVLLDHPSAALAKMSREAVALALNNAELDVFVDLLFSGGHPLFFLGVTPSAELIPAVIEAYKTRACAEHSAFRPFRIDFIHMVLLKFHDVWPAAAERRVRPCTHCLARNSYFRQYGTDHYHFENGTVGRLTVEISHSSGYRSPHWTENNWSYG
ncbi:hypothetical protein AAVH_31942 [Aphelenchoides avenae]|nr:hypothetical protein AAVH_31942 [Aphelenchus avenae]